LNYVATVYNGIDTSKFESAPQSERNYLLFIGRLGYDKGTAEAIDIAGALDLPLKLAGKIDDADRAYFDSHVKPRLDAYPKAEYVGEVNSDQKRDLYSRALAVVYPINFDEPFGLVMVEALASGTPVLALKRGSVSEILVDKKTAVIGGNVRELIARFPEIAQIKSSDCIEHVNKLFTAKHMVDGYEAVYEQLIEKRKGGRLIGSPIGVLLA
jgi:glycosyltransferase involved in cell wall biosynthesis